MLTSPGTRIRHLREDRRLTQTQLARRCNLSQSYLSEVEHGRTRPSLACLGKLAEGLGMPVEGLIEGTFYKIKHRGKRLLRRRHPQLRRAFHSGGSPRDPMPTLRVAFRESQATILGPGLLVELDRQSHEPEYWKAVKRIANDLNGDEQDFLLHLLTGGFDLEEIHPWRLGIRRALIDRFGGRYYAAVRQVGDVWIVVYPQLGVVTGHGRFRMLDFLVGVGVGPKPVWMDYEVDAVSHRGREDEDAIREKQVKFVRVKVPSGQLQMKDFAARFVRSVLGRVQKMAA